MPTKVNSMITMDAAREFYAFMVERESIRLRRVLGRPREEWTQDPVLREYKFTNVKRAHDRTTRQLVAEFYRPNFNACARVQLLNCAVARLFGTIETMREIGWSEAWGRQRRDRVERIVQAMIKAKRQVFTGAYIIPNCGSTKKKHLIVLDILDSMWKFAQTRYPKDAEPLPQHRWQDLCEGMQTVRGIGPFLAKEIILDFILATGWKPWDWDSWTPVGPGARRGVGRLSDGGALRVAGEAESLGAIRCLWNVRDLWPATVVLTTNIGGVEREVTQVLTELEFTDIQFQLCEFDKYLRVKRGEGRPRSRFRPTESST